MFQELDYQKTLQIKDNAIKLMEYLTSEEAQNTYVNNSYEYAANPNVKPSKIVQSWGTFNRDN